MIITSIFIPTIRMVHVRGFIITINQLITLNTNLRPYFPEPLSAFVQTWEADSCPSACRAKQTAKTLVTPETPLDSKYPKVKAQCALPLKEKGQSPKDHQNLLLRQKRWSSKHKSKMRRAGTLGHGRQLSIFVHLRWGFFFFISRRGLLTCMGAKSLQPSCEGISLYWSFYFTPFVSCMGV